MASTVALQAQLVNAARRYLQLRFGSVSTHLHDGSVLFVFSPLADDAELVTEVQRLCGALMRDVRNRSSHYTVAHDSAHEEEEEEGENNRSNDTKDDIGSSRILARHRSTNGRADLADWHIQDAIPFATLVAKSSGAALVPSELDTLTRDVPQACALLELLYRDVVTDDATDSGGQERKIKDKSTEEEVTSGEEEVRVVVNFPPAMCAIGSRVDVIIHRQVCIRAYSRTDAGVSDDEEDSKNSSSIPSHDSLPKHGEEDSSDEHDEDENVTSTKHTDVKSNTSKQQRRSIGEAVRGHLWVDTDALAKFLAVYASTALERVLPALWRDKSFSLEDAGEVLRHVYAALDRYMRSHSRSRSASLSGSAARRTEMNVRVLLAVVSSDIRQLIASQLMRQGGELGVWRVKMDTMETAVRLCRQWYRIVTALMHNDGTRCSRVQVQRSSRSSSNHSNRSRSKRHAPTPLGSEDGLHDPSMDRLAARLEDVWRVRQLLHSIAALVERVPDTMLPETIFASAGVFGASVSQWSRALRRFEKELSFLEPALRQRVKQLLARQTYQVAGTQAPVRTLMPYRVLLGLPGIHRAVEREMEQLSQQMVRQLDEMQNRYAQLSRSGTATIPTATASDNDSYHDRDGNHRVRLLALIRGVVVECVALTQQARQLFGAQADSLAGAVEVKAHRCMSAAYADAERLCVGWRLEMVEGCRVVAAQKAAVTLDSLPVKRRIAHTDDNNTTINDSRGNASEDDDGGDDNHDNESYDTYVRCRVHPRVSALRHSALEFRRGVAVLAAIRHDTRASTAHTNTNNSQAGQRSGEDGTALSASEEETIRACEQIVAVAQRTQQCVVFYNTTRDEILPCTRAMLRPLLQKALSQVFVDYSPSNTNYNSDDEEYNKDDYNSNRDNNGARRSSPAVPPSSGPVRAIGVANYAELDVLNARFHHALVAQCQQNRQVLRFHDYLTTQVMALHAVDLTRQMDRWRSVVDGLRRGFDDYIAQHRLRRVGHWRRYWDGQLYKALELQYRRGLASLHEAMEPFRVELVFKNGAVQFNPSLEAMREAYYVKMREFISVPLRFRGLQAKREESRQERRQRRGDNDTVKNDEAGGRSAMYEMYPLMLIANRDRIVTVHNKTMELFAKLARLRRAFRQHVVVGLCGLGGAPDLDSIVEAWGNAEQQQSDNNANTDDASEGKRAAGAADGDTKDGNGEHISGSGSNKKKDSHATSRSRHRAGGDRAQRYAAGLRLVSERLDKMTAIEDSMTIDCFIISVIPVKASVTEQLHRLSEALIQSMRQGIQRTVKEMDDFVFVASNAVERRPMTLDEVSLANKALREYRGRMRVYEHAFARIEAENAELRAHAVQTFTAASSSSTSMSAASTTVVELAGLRSRWEHLREAMSSHTKTMEGSVTKMRGSLEHLIQRFVKEVDRFGSLWVKQKTALMQAFRSGNTEQVRRLLPAIEDQVRDVEDLTRRAADLQNKSDDLNQPRPSFAGLESTVRDIARMRTQWELYNAFEQQLDSLRGEDWLTFRTHLYLFEDFCNVWREKLQERKNVVAASAAAGGQSSRDGKTLTGRNEKTATRADRGGSSRGGESRENVVADYLERVLRDWSQLIPLLRFVRGDGWMTEHWNEMFRLLELSKETSSATLTFGDVVSHDRQILQRRDELRGLFLRAQGEIQLREALQDVRTWALDARFTLVTPSSSSALGEPDAEAGLPPSPDAPASVSPSPAPTRVKLITGWSDVLTQVSDNQALIASLRDSPFYSHFADEISGWETNLVTLSESLMLLNRIQRKWTYLEPIFARGALPHEQARFRRVDKEFVRTLCDIEADSRVMSLIAHGDFIDRAHTLLEQMDRCQRSLQEFLDGKRDKMPRFYFISDEDLLEILGKSQSPLVIQTHLKKLFMGIHAVEWGDAGASAITHIRSSDGERVTLRESVSIADGADVEDWLIRLDATVRRTLRVALVRCVAESSNTPHGAAAAVMTREAESTRGEADDGRDSESAPVRPPPPQGAPTPAASPDMFPSQVLQVCQEVLFVRRVESALGSHPDGLRALHQQLSDTLHYLTHDMGQRRTRSDTLTRKALILGVIHQRSVVELLRSQSVREVDSWWWNKQLRYYLRDEPARTNRDRDSSNGDEAVASAAVVRMADAQLNYTYEYQGNAPKLVHTPLTDRCYLVLTQGMQFGYGGNPYGPAGTGKTESVKALGNALGRQVLVFNCDEGIDFRSMGRIFTGLIRCGAWGCFDEFNRLRIDQLSAVSQMIQGIQSAIKAREPSCTLLGRSIAVNPSAGIFVTLNPAGKGYGGRSKLPDNLKQLFRSIAMSVPDKELIVATTLMSEGFGHGPELARGVTELYTLSAQLLSVQQHYDWGLRAMKAVLQLSGTLLQRWREQNRHPSSGTDEAGDDGNSRHDSKHDTIHSSSSSNSSNLKPSLQTETELVVHSLEINTLSKLTLPDATLFRGLVRDIFPRVVVEREANLYAELSAAVARATRVLGLQPLADQTHRVMQLYEALRQRMGVVLVGPSGSGKSTLIRILRQTLQEMGTRVPVHVMNPKAMPRDQLLGRLDPDTREWFDGVLTQAARAVVQEAATTTATFTPAQRSMVHTRPWIICDGDIDPEWVESLNSVLDDNKLLTMPNGVRIQFGDHVNFIFETHSLEFASPATVSRLGVVFFSETDGEGLLTAVTESTLAALPADQRNRLSPLVMKYVLTAVEEIFAPHADKDEFSDLDGGGMSRGSNHAIGAKDALVVPMLSRMACLRTCLFHVMSSENESDFVYALLRALGALLRPHAAAAAAQRIMSLADGAVATVANAAPLQTHWNRRTQQVTAYVADLTLVEDSALRDEEEEEEEGNAAAAAAGSSAANNATSHSASSSSSAVVFTAEAVLTRPLPLVRTAEFQRLLATLEPLIRVDYMAPSNALGDNGSGSAATTSENGANGGAGANTHTAGLTSTAAMRLPAIFVLGESGSGKCRMLEHAVGALTQSGSARLVTLCCSAHTRAAAVVQKLEEVCSLYNTGYGRVYRPREAAGRVVLVLKNVNLVRPDRYGTVELHAFLHQLITHGGFYSTELEWLGVERVQVVGSMTVSTASPSSSAPKDEAVAVSSEAEGLGYYPVSARLMSAVHVVTVPTPSSATLVQIYTVYWRALLPLLQHRAQHHRRVERTSSSDDSANDDGGNRNTNRVRAVEEEENEEGKGNGDVSLVSSPVKPGADVREYDGGRMLAQYMLAVYTKLRQRQSRDPTTRGGVDRRRDGRTDADDVAAMTFTPRLLTSWMTHTLMYHLTTTHAGGGGAGGGLASVLAYEGCRLMGDGLPRASVRGRAARTVYELLAMIGVDAGDARKQVSTDEEDRQANAQDAEDAPSSGYVSWATSHSNNNNNNNNNNDNTDATSNKDSSKAGHSAGAHVSTSMHSLLAAPLHHRPYQSLYEDIVSARQRYGRTFRELSLCVTASTIHWVARLDRALWCPRGGHAMLVGSPGVGRRDVVMLTAFMQRMEVIEPGATSSTSNNDSSTASSASTALLHRRRRSVNSVLGSSSSSSSSGGGAAASMQRRQIWGELRSAVQRAVLQDERILLLMSDHHLEDEMGMDYINALVDIDGTAAVTTLFSPEEVEAMRASLRSQLSSSSSSPAFTTQTLLLSRLRRNLHVALVLDSEHAHFGSSLRANPSLLRGCSLLWMGTWHKAEMRQQCQARLRALASSSFSLLYGLLSSTTGSSTAVPRTKSARGDDDAHRGEAGPDHSWGRFESLEEAMVHIHHTHTQAQVHNNNYDSTSSSSSNGTIDRCHSATPSQLTLLITTFATLLTQQQHRRAEREHRLGDGLSALDTAEAEVRTIAQTVTEQQAQLATLQQASQTALNEIQSHMQHAHEQRHAAQSLERQLAAEDKAMTRQRERVEDELSTIQPLLDSAREAVRGIRTEQLHEIRSFKSPPEPIRDVLEGVLGLLGMRDVSWSAMRSFLAERGVKERIVDFDVHQVTPAIRQSVARLVQQKQLSFTEEVIYRASVAAAPMARWVQAILSYAERLEQTAPLHAQLDTLAESQAQGSRRLTQLRDELEQIASAVSALREDFAQRCRDAERVKTELQRGEERMGAATELLHKLAGEKERWVRDVGQMARARVLMARRALLAAAFMTYLTAEGEESRARWMREWGQGLGLGMSNMGTNGRMSKKHAMQSRVSENSDDSSVQSEKEHARCDGRGNNTDSVVQEEEGGEEEGGEEEESFEKSVSFTRFMRTEAELLQFRSDGLPEDELSRENAIVVLETVHTPLLIDPAQQAVTWLQQHIASHARAPHPSTSSSSGGGNDGNRDHTLLPSPAEGDLFSLPRSAMAAMEVVALHDPRLVHTLELAIRFGKTLLIRDVDHIPDILFPVLRREFVAVGAKRVVQVGSKSVDWQDSFRLLLVTRRAQVQLPPSAAALVTCVNFAVTSCGLTSQLLGLTIRHERSDWEKQKVRLLHKEEQLRTEVAELEEELLKELAQARSGGGNMLSNAPLMRSLDEVQQRAAEAQGALAQSRALQVAMDRKRNMYRPLAVRGSLLFAVMDDLARLNRMYQFGLAGFMELFAEVLTQRSKDAKRGGAGSHDRDSPDHDSAAHANRTDDAEEERGFGVDANTDTVDVEDDSAGDDAATHMRVRALTQQLTQICFRTTAAALFRRDQPLFALHLLRHLHPEHFDSGMWDLFVGTAAAAANTAPGDDAPNSRQKHTQSGSGNNSNMDDDSDEDASGQSDERAEGVAPEGPSSVSVSPPPWAPLSTHAPFRALLARAPASFVTRVQTYWKLYNHTNDTGRNDWRTWVRSGKPESNDSLARLGLTSLSAMDRLLLVSTFRPDRLLALMQSLLQQQLRRDGVFFSPAMMTVTLRDAIHHRSSATRPLLLLVGSGADPSIAIEDIATSQFETNELAKSSAGEANASSRLVQVALGGGQTDVAIEQLQRAAVEGHWLLLKNVHLVLNWAMVLEQEWAALTTPSTSSRPAAVAIHPSFRLILTTEAEESFPVELLRRCAVVTVEMGGEGNDDDNQDNEQDSNNSDSGTKKRSKGGAGVRAAVQRVYERWGVRNDDESEKDKQDEEETDSSPARHSPTAHDSEDAIMRRSLSWLHAVAVGRRDYVPQGWLKRYEFTDADVKMAWAVTSQVRSRRRDNSRKSNSSSVDWLALHGVLSDGVYGGRLDAVRDEAVLRGLLNRFLGRPNPSRSSMPAIDVQNEDALTVLALPANANGAVQEMLAREALWGLRQLSAAKSSDLNISSLHALRTNAARTSSVMQRLRQQAASLTAPPSLSSSAFRDSRSNHNSASSSSASAHRPADPLTLFAAAEVARLRRAVLAVKSTAQSVEGADWVALMSGQRPKRWVAALKDDNSADDNSSESSSTGSANEQEGAAQQGEVWGWLRRLQRLCVAATRRSSSVAASASSSFSGVFFPPPEVDLVSSQSHQSNNNDDVSPYLLHLVDLVRPQAFLAALRQHTARQSRVALVDLVLTAVLTGTSEERVAMQSGALVTGQTILLDGSFVGLQGAVLHSDGSLRPPQPDTPSTVALSHSIRLGWGSAEATATKKNTMAEVGPRVPVYTSVHRTTLLFELTVGRGPTAEEVLVLHGVACYLMQDG